MPLRLQELIHQFEVGAGTRYVRLACALIAFLGIAVLYDALCYRNLATSEAMDAAQLGRNIAEGRGYTTWFVRPFSMNLLREHRADQSSLIKDAHPDIANPPVYPLLLAGMMKITPREHDVMQAKRFTVYRPDLFIAMLNQLLFLVAAALVFTLAVRMFSPMVGWISVIVFVGGEVYWRFSISGLSTMLLIVITLVLLLLLFYAEQWQRTERAPRSVVSLAAAAGACIGVGALTRYAFGLALIPVVIFFIMFFGQRRIVLGVAAALACAAVLVPWIARNMIVSGRPFGTATFAIVQQTETFNTDRLERSLHPGLGRVGMTELTRKFLRNAKTIVQNDLPKLSGSWVTAFFLVGLLVPFQHPALGRIRWLVLLLLVVFALAEALGGTHASIESPQINTDNLLIVLAPVIAIFGVSLFVLLFESLPLTSPGSRVAVIASFCTLVSLPLLLSLLPPHPGPVVHPPYFPPRIQQVGAWMGERELVMSDVPWAVAWYGRRQCVWLTLDWNKDFYEISDTQKAVQAVYFTPKTTDANYFSGIVGSDPGTWGNFLLQAMIKSEVPTGFPLRKAPQGFFRDGHILLTDYERWRVHGK